VTEIDSKVFVVFDLSSFIQVYDAHSFKQLSRIIVEGLAEPHDIVACRQDHELYVADKDGIWRVSTEERHRYEKWLTIKSSWSSFYINTLSLTSIRLLVTLPRGLRQYNTTNKELLRDIECPEYMKCLYNSIETARGTFIISHHGTSQDRDLYAVSEKFYYSRCRRERFCKGVLAVLSPDTHFSRPFSRPLQKLYQSISDPGFELKIALGHFSRSFPDVCFPSVMYVFLS